MSSDILVSDLRHPTSLYLKSNPIQNTNLHSKIGDLKGGRFLFLVSVQELISKEITDKYDFSFVIHGSDLPKGRGWSPISWQIVEGHETFHLSLISACGKVDRGEIFDKKRFTIPKHADFEKISELIAENTHKIIKETIQKSHFTPKAQDESLATYYTKRTPEMSEIDINMPLAQQFDLLRSCDPNRYPAFFTFHGRKHTLKMSMESD